MGNRTRKVAEMLGGADFSTGKMNSRNLDVSFENIVDTGTEGLKVPVGTTAQRGSTQGQWRYNTTTGFFEGFNGTTFSSLAPSPTVTSVSPTTVDSAAGGNETFTIDGSNFGAGDTVKFIGNDGTEITASSVTINSTIELSAVIARSSFANAKEPYDVKVINTAGVSGQLDDQINVDTAPVFANAAGNIADLDDIETANVSNGATDADGDTITYSVQSGSLPAGTSLNTSTGAITGALTDVASDTTSSFTIRASTTQSNVDRAFNIIVRKTLDGTTSARAARSCKAIFDVDSSFQGSSADGLYYVTNHGTISATQHYCLMDTSYSSGGWTLLYSMNDGNGFASGTNYTFNITTGSPSITADYGLDRRNTFTPAANDQFLLRREDNNDWVRHVVSQWSPTVNGVSNGWETSYSVSGNNTNHPQWGEGTTYNSSGSNLNLQYFNGCALGGNCASGGGDGSGFSDYQNWSYGVSGSTAYGGAYNGQGAGGSPIFWGANNNINGTRITMWYKKNGTQ